MFFVVIGNWTFVAHERVTYRSCAIWRWCPILILIYWQ